jgi:hypothetical protein
MPVRDSVEGQVCSAPAIHCTGDSSLNSARDVEPLEAGPFPDSPIPTSVDEVCDGDEPISCKQCGDIISGDVYLDDCDCYCPRCMDELVSGHRVKAAAYAEDQCRITRRPLPGYDYSLEERCTQEEYENGDKEPYTPNVYLMIFLHNYTNYYVLIKPLRKESFLDGIYYAAIRRRTMSLIGEAIREDGVDLPDLEEQTD